jgi:hypothetical protein
VNGIDDVSGREQNEEKQEKGVRSTGKTHPCRYKVPEEMWYRCYLEWTKPEPAHN